MTQVAQQTLAEYTAGTLIHATIEAGLGAVLAGVFTSISPIGGALFGFSSVIGTHTVNLALNWAGLGNEESTGKVLKIALSFFGGILIGTLVATAVGFPMTFTAGLALTGCMLAATIAATVVFGLCISLMIGATALFINTNTTERSTAV